MVTVVEHRLNRVAPGSCIGRMFHVFRRETRPWPTDPTSRLREDRVVCERCLGVLFDWDGPFEQYVEPRK